ncbi:hypothetical protein HDV00_010031 [Rhizophlyctis rosea]|nr:hypothetical protein HDV00_010031 [Rhizophlyctis rosea]
MEPSSTAVVDSPSFASGGDGKEDGGMDNVAVVPGQDAEKPSVVAEAEGDPPTLNAPTASDIFVHMDFGGDPIMGFDSRGSEVKGRMVRDLSKRTFLQVVDIEEHWWVSVGAEAERFVDGGEDGGRRSAEARRGGVEGMSSFLLLKMEAGGMEGVVESGKEDVEDDGDVEEDASSSSSLAGPGPTSTFGVRRATLMGIGAECDGYVWESVVLLEVGEDENVGKKEDWKGFSL